MSGRVDTAGRVTTVYEERFEVTTEWCVAINNIDYVRQSLKPFVEQLSMDDIIQKMCEARSPVEAQRWGDVYIDRSNRWRLFLVRVTFATNDFCHEDYDDLWPTVKIAVVVGFIGVVDSVIVGVFVVRGVNVVVVYVFYKNMLISPNRGTWSVKALTCITIRSVKKSVRNFRF